MSARIAVHQSDMTFHLGRERGRGRGRGRRGAEPIFGSKAMSVMQASGQAAGLYQTCLLVVLHNIQQLQNAEVRTGPKHTCGGLKRKLLTSLYPMHYETGWESSLSAFKIVYCGLLVTSRHVEHPGCTPGHQCLSTYFRTSSRTQQHRNSE